MLDAAKEGEKFTKEFIKNVKNKWYIPQGHLRPSDLRCTGIPSLVFPGSTTILTRQEWLMKMRDLRPSWRHGVSQLPV